MLGESAAFSSFSVDDPSAAKRFYEETLGLEVEEVDMGEEMAGQLFSITIAGGHDVFVYAKGEAHAPATFTVLNFPVDDLAATVDALAERGVEFERYEGMEHDERGIHTGGGPLIAWFTDPAGNVLSVVENDEQPNRGA